MVEFLYILGSTRSGTSALRNAIYQTKYKGFGEGHTVPILIAIIKEIYRAKSNPAADVNGNALNALDAEQLISALFQAYENHQAEAVKSRFILDKTPNVIPIENAATLLRHHTRARFVHCSRRHIDNIDSKVRKFPQHPFRNHCIEWAKCIAAWQEAKVGLRGHYVDFDYYYLVNDVEGTAARIADLLELEKGEVLAMANYLKTERPQASPDRELVKYIKFSEVTWSDEDRDIFTRVCVPVGKSLGYGLESYFD